MILAGGEPTLFILALGSKRRGGARLAPQTLSFSFPSLFQGKQTRATTPPEDTFGGVF